MNDSLLALTHRYKQLAPDSDLHGSYYPADIYPGESVSANLRMTAHDPSHWTSARVWRVSPLGLEVIATEAANCVAGTTLDVELKLGQQVTSLKAVVTAHVQNSLGETVTGLRLIDRDVEPYDGANRRNQSRWICSEQFFPVAVAANPARFNDFVYARARDLSADGMKLYTSLRNKFLVQGMTLQLTLNLPMVSQLQVPVVIRNVNLAVDNGKDYLALGVSFVKLDPMSRQAIGQYLIQFGHGVSLRELREQQLAPRSVASSIEFSFVRSIDDYRDVLELRKFAYVGAGKISPDVPSSEMGDIYDVRSRIVIGKYQGRVVASAGLVFHEYHDRMEVEEFLEWPDGLPRRDEVVEVIRNCTHPEFRGSDLLMSMFKFIAIAILQSRRQYVVISCTPDLIPLYHKIGLQDQKLEYRHRKLNGARHTVMLGDVPSTVAGGLVNPIYWNAIWADTLKYLRTSNSVELNALSRTRVAIYQLAGPVAALMQYWMRRPRKAK
jgi:hypothetical protein